MIKSVMNKVQLEIKTKVINKFLFARKRFNVLHLLKWKRCIMNILWPVIFWSCCFMQACSLLCCFSPRDFFNWKTKELLGLFWLSFFCITVWFIWITSSILFLFYQTLINTMFFSKLAVHLMEWVGHFMVFCMQSRFYVYYFWKISWCIFHFK